MLLFSPPFGCVKYSCPRLYCIVYYHAQLIVCNGIVLHSIVIIIGCIKSFNFYIRLCKILFQAILLYGVAFFYV